MNKVIQLKIRYYITAIKLAKMQKITILSVGVNAGKYMLSYIAYKI
jgi:hypothetical protein